MNCFGHNSLNKINSEASFSNHPWHHSKKTQTNPSKPANIMQSVPLRQSGGHPRMFATKIQKHTEMVPIQADTHTKTQTKITDGLPQT